MTFKFRCAGVILIFTVSASVMAAAPASAPSSKPSAEDEAIDRVSSELVEFLARNPSDQEMMMHAEIFRSRSKFARAAAFHLIALRGKGARAEIEYELARDFADLGKKELAIAYLDRAAVDGYWGYRIIQENHYLDALRKEREFPAVLAKIKGSFDVEAPKHKPRVSFNAASKKAPVGGWPTVVFLHQREWSMLEFNIESGFVASLGYLGIIMDANEVMGPGSFTWGRDVQTTHANIQTALNAQGNRVNVKRVYLIGIGEGAVHAARLISDHPDAYAGVGCISPPALDLLPQKLPDAPHTGPIVFSLGNNEPNEIKKAVKSTETLWENAKRPTQTLHVAWEYQSPEERESNLRLMMRLLSGGN